ncbi:MAG: biotin/lipoyl-binding protein [Zoogloeaceae bacterium]|nr:biotin/lipoyl-binding protein [Rhodocyclaceae bacterium]MCP5234552.1 biotin/lipoyl-binding protein [Zoogloeaceae bacterium]
MILRRLLPIAVIVVGAAGFLALKASRPAPPAVEARERVWRIETRQVAPGEARPTLVVYGRIEAPDRLRAASPVSGRILEVAVRDGQLVDAGALLARLDPGDLLPRVERARAEVERERIRHRHDREAIVEERRLRDLAEASVERLSRLKKAQLGAESALDQAREALARARLALTQREQSLAEHPARLSQLQANLAEAERDAARGLIRAPFAGRIAGVEVAAGDQVQPGQALMSLYAAADLFLRARVPVDYAAELRRALAAGETPTAEAEYGERRIAARLERIGGEADARGIDVLLRLIDGDDVPVGAFLAARLQRPIADGVIELPYSALHGGDRIYRIEGGRLASVAVTRVGERRDGDDVRVLLRAPQLAAGSEVMLTHLPNAIDGLAVEPLTR